MKKGVIRPQAITIDVEKVDHDLNLSICINTSVEIEGMSGLLSAISAHSAKKSLVKSILAYYLPCITFALTVGSPD
jgi:hypothetical protein